MTEITIEKGVELPQFQYKGGRRAKYPWPLLKQVYNPRTHKGDSFFVETNEVERVQKVVSTCGRQWARNNMPERVFTVRRMNGGVRVWRIA